MALLWRQSLSNIKFKLNKLDEVCIVLNPFCFDAQCRVYFALKLECFTVE